MSRVSSSRYRVPYLHEKQVEREAQLLLDEWATAGHKFAAPVPLDDLVELHLGLTYEVVDLRTRFECEDILGAIWFNENIIRIDTSLDPHDHPAMLGRFNFTLAHEIGHWRLHRQHLRSDPHEAMLFEANGRPAFVCRSSEKPPEERQADMFAGCLLMPRDLVRSAWFEWRGTHDPVAVRDLEVGDLHGDREKDENVAKERFCKPLAERFEVSAQALRIRLEKLELLVKEIEPGLF